ncbi:hypothetical protein OV079_33415 [Nannocystis pusilla]|uniref:Uncharacterized protein n=1 Tax=Nannocystis pusilla TaxID=889268 RepID=A0A9X3EU93_9BACT|nr:hypothetical protein [Nannocystis pusilla]MCY1010382.1 hypothetical protein [Nannocystis pusilla]
MLEDSIGGAAGLHAGVDVEQGGEGLEAELGPGRAGGDEGVQAAQLAGGRGGLDQPLGLDEAVRDGVGVHRGDEAVEVDVLAVDRAAGVVEEQRAAGAEGRRGRDVAVVGEGAEGGDEGLHERVLACGEGGDDLVAAGVVGQDAGVEQPVDAEVRIVGDALVLGGEGLGLGGAVVEGAAQVAVGAARHVLVAVDGLPAQLVAAGEEPHEPLIALQQLGRGGPALAGRLELARPEAIGDVVLVLVGLGLRVAVGGVVFDAVEAERDLAGLVVLPPHLAAVTQVGQVIVVALVVEDVEAGQGLVDRAEVAEVAPEVRGDQIFA